jgi:uncharacterized membrane protein
VSFFAQQLHHHLRVYIALIVGLVGYVAGVAFAVPVPLALAGDISFAVFLVLSWRLVFLLGSDDLDRRADVADEGVAIVMMIAVAAIALICFDIFSALNHKPRLDVAWLILALSAAALGWLTFHTIFAFHYANLYYARLGSPPETGEPPLKFPGTPRPGTWDFVYFSFVLGMTAQVADVLVTATDLRRTVLAHSMLSFFFNTVLIAMAVNVAVAVFQGA